jgi:hypothetical protein
LNDDLITLSKIPEEHTIQREVRMLETRYLSMQSEQVYANKESAVEDFVRLVRLGDIEGVKIRVAQLFKEKKT